MAALSLRALAATKLISINQAQESFYEFAKQAWVVVEGGLEYKDGWHIKAICDHLQAAFERRIPNLLMNLPPRCMKSTLLGVMWPAWCWIHNPNERFLTSSYAAHLSRRDARRCKNLIMSRWYQERWGHLYQIDKDQKTKTFFSNDKKGYYLATSTGGSATGDGGTILISDDANNVKHAESEAKREDTINWFDGVWSTRGNSILNTVNIVAQQRTHEEDISGHILSMDFEGDWVKFIIPMEYESERKCKTTKLSANGPVWEDPRTVDGELLWPEQIPKKGLELLKRKLGSATRIAGQLQQRPRAQEGDMIKREWFQWWKKPKSPELIQVIQSWDTAMSDKKSACYSACTTWGLFYDEKDQLNILLLNAYRGKIAYPELRARAKKLSIDYRDDGEADITPDKKHQPDYVLIESKSSGISLLQDFAAAGIIAFGFNPDKWGDKTARVNVITHLLESGRVWLPAKSPLYTSLRKCAEEFLESCVSFPGERDYTDSMVQVLLRLQTARWLRNPDDEQDEDTSVYLKQQIY